MKKQNDIIIRRISTTTYSFSESSEVGMRHVAKALTYEYQDEYFSKKYTKINKAKKTFQIGMLNDLETYCRKKNLRYQLFDYDFQLPEGTKIDGRMGGKYIHQTKAVEAFYKKRFGIIVVPTRGGKTFIASEIFRIFLNNFSGNICFCTDTIDLFNQAVGDIKTYFEPYGGIEVGEIKEGKIDVSKRITVAMVQTIQSTFSKRNKDRKKRSLLSKYLLNLGFLAVDEIHENSSPSKLKIYKKCKRLECCLCLSATPYRSNAFIANLELKEWSGDVVYTISESTLRKRKVLSDYKVFILSINHNDKILDAKKHQDYNFFRKTLIFDNEERNEILIKIVELFREMGFKVLLLFQSIEHGKLIERLAGIPFISGETKSEDRQRAKEEFLLKEGGELSASNIFKKGITLPEVQILINVDGGFEDANTIQRKGRVLGATERKTKSLVIDFFDVFDYYFSEHSITRLETYISSIGEKRVEILDTAVEDWYETFKKYTIKWLGKTKNSSDTL